MSLDAEKMPEFSKLRNKTMSWMSASGDGLKKKHTALCPTPNLLGFCDLPIPHHGRFRPAGPPGSWRRAWGSLLCIPGGKMGGTATVQEIWCWRRTWFTKITSPAGIPHVQTNPNPLKFQTCHFTPQRIQIYNQHLPQKKTKRISLPSGKPMNKFNKQHSNKKPPIVWWFIPPIDRNIGDGGSYSLY